MVHDRIVNQHTPGIALYPRSLSYDLLPLIGPAGWSLLRALHDHADEQALTYRGARPIAPSAEELQALAGVGEASLLVIKDLLRICGCLSWEDVRGKQAPRPGRPVKQAPTRALVYYLHPLTGLTVTTDMVQRVCQYALRSDRAQAYLKANGLLRRQPAYLPMSVWPTLLPWLLTNPTWQTLFQHVHGADAHRTYQAAAARWLMSAADVIATLEWEQQSLHDQTQIDVQKRAVMVLARWNATDTVASWRGNGPYPANRDDSPPSPHTPNESTNQSTRQVVGGGGTKHIERDRRRSDRHTPAASSPSRLAEAEVHVVQQADAAGQLESATPRNVAAVLPADAEATAQAEAALWAALPPLLAGASWPGQNRNDQPRYQPTRSESRQARRLLRAHRLDTILAAVRAVCATYEPAPGQPASITRFGFAVGLPAFRAALASATRNYPSSALPTAPPISEAGKSGCGTMEQDFWSEYSRVTGRAARVAERRRIEAVAALVEWQQLLIWLDRWEQAHPHGDAQLSPGYFETCAAEGTNRTHSARPSQPPEAAAPAPPQVRTPEQQHAFTRLAEYGITTAPTLAALPTTTTALVDAWIGAAAQRATIKDKRAYVAAGVKSGQWPLDRRFKPQPAPVVHPPGSAESLPVQAEHGVWDACLKQVAGIVPPAEFETWIQPCALVELDQAQVVIGTPNVFVREHVAQRYHRVIQQAVERVTGYAVKPLFVIQS